ncbi:MAG TPA: ATP-binding protein [Candidatus Sabulitectum sp.]|nr:ATP-binding protein [Candidatus Sabulitectum sp.]
MGLKDFFFKDVSIRRVVVVPAIILVTIFTFTSGYLATRSGEKAVSEVSASLRREISANIGARLFQYISEPESVCRSIAEMMQGEFVDHRNPHELQKCFLSQLNCYPGITSIYFGNINGGLADAGREISDGRLYIIETSNFAAGDFLKYHLEGNGERSAEPSLIIPDFDARTRGWYIDAEAVPDSPVRTDPYRVFTEDGMAISTSLAVSDSNGTFLGVIACDIFLEDLSVFLKNLRVGETGFAFIFDGGGTIFAASGPLDPLASASPATIWDADHPAIQAIASAVQVNRGSMGSIDEPLEVDTRGFHCLVTPFSDGIGSTYFTAVVLPDSDFMVYLDAHGERSILIMAGGFLASVLLGILAARLIARPVLDLHRNALAMSRGEEGAFQGSRITELNDLSGAFTALTEALKSQVAERRAAEEALAESEERIQLALRGTGAATWDWDLESDQIRVNARWAEMLGLDLSDVEPVTAKVWRRFTHPDDFPGAMEAFDAHCLGKTPMYEAEFRMKHADGSWIWVLDRGKVIKRDSSGRPLRAAGTHLDITRRKNAETSRNLLQEQVNKSRRLDSIGKLAGGVAHDLNNLLTPVIGYTEMLIDRWRDEAALLEILKAGKSARRLVGQLLAFGRRQYLELGTHDLNAIISSHRELLRTAIRDNIILEMKLNPEPLPVFCDEGKVEQVLMNLVVNAAEAMPDGGELLVETGMSVFPEDGSSDAPMGSSAVLVVADTGRGMTDLEMSRVFEPFYTTKGASGTGLGLSTVYGIVKQHGGTVEVSSRKGRGTVFTVMLPLSGDAPTMRDPLREIPSGKSGGELVLVVEDSEDVRELTEKALSSLGYETLSALSGDQALEMLESMERKPALMLTDVIMPGLSAGMLREKAAVVAPEMKVIYMSGYSGNVVFDSDGEGRAIPFLPKPFTVKELEEAVRSVLN